MAKFRFTVEVDTDTQEHAEQVIGERVYFDEEYTDEAGEDVVYFIQVVDLPTQEA